MTTAGIQNALNDAFRHQQSGHLSQAESLYRQVLYEAPYHPEALHLLGVLAYQAGKMEAALDLIHQAIMQKPQCADFHSNEGLVLASMGRLSDAIASYRRALDLQPNSPGILNNLGNALSDLGQFDQALPIFQKLISLQPNNPVGYNNLANVLRATGKLNESAAAYEKAVAIAPDYTDALNNLGTMLAAMGKTDRAIELLGRAVKINPDSPDVLYNFANALRASGQTDAAIAEYRKALAIRREFPEACNNLGNLLHLLGGKNLDESIALLRQAVKLRPDVVDAHLNLFAALSAHGMYDSAIEEADRWLAIHPNDGETWNLLGNAMYASSRLPKAKEAYQRAAALLPNCPQIQNNLANVYKEMGELDQALASYDRGLACEPGDPHVRASIAGHRILCLIAHPNYDEPTIFQELRKWNQAYAAPLARSIQPHRNETNPDRKIRIGYLSGDFCNHVAGLNLLPLVRNHNRSEFEIFFYDNNPALDRVTQEFQSLADGWRNIENMDDESAAKIIRDDQIDILMDLSLHSARGRELVVARKPAPLQGTFIGYPGSTGMDAVDFRLTDPYLDPPGLGDEFYSEHSIRLPESFWCYDPIAMEAPETPVTPPPALSNGRVTFGCLNSFHKINDPVLRLWARVLRETPGSHMLMLVTEGPARQRVAEMMQREGVELTRLEFVGRLSRKDYHQTYQRIDVALDTFPYNGHTTSLDAFWSGVPVLTLVGKTVVGRAGLSQLSNLGLSELAARNCDEFVQIARALTADVPHLEELRGGLRDRMRASPICDASRFARNVETVYREQWRKWCIKGAGV